MPDQLLRRSRVTVNQRTDLEDFNRTNESALGNLVLAMRYLLAPGLGVVRGGGLVPTDPPSMLCTLLPLGALAPNGAGAGLLIVESDRSVGPFAPNTSGNPRIDLVSVRYAEALASQETRKFQNPDATWYDSPVPTEIAANPLVTITQGVPSANPVAPNTPAGDLALYQVRIDHDATQIIANTIARVETDRTDPLRIGQKGGELNIPLPWNSAELLELATPALSQTFFAGMLTIQPGLLNDGIPLQLSIQDIDAGVNVGVSYALLPNPGAPYTQHVTLFVMGCVPGPTGTAPTYTDAVRRYRFRLQAQNGAGVPASGATTLNLLLAAVTL